MKVRYIFLFCVNSCEKFSFLYFMAFMQPFLFNAVGTLCGLIKKIGVYIGIGIAIAKRPAAGELIKFE